MTVRGTWTVNGRRRFPGETSAKFIVASSHLNCNIRREFEKFKMVGDLKGPTRCQWLELEFHFHYKIRYWNRFLNALIWKIHHFVQWFSSFRFDDLRKSLIRLRTMAKCKESQREESTLLNGKIVFGLDLISLFVYEHTVH